MKAAIRTVSNTEGCYATVCPGDAHDPIDAASRYGDGLWCPGHCWRFWALVLEERRRSGGCDEGRGLG